MQTIINGINSFISAHPYASFAFIGIAFITVCIVATVITAPTINDDQEL